MEHREPTPIKPTKLIVLLAFIRDEEGELRPAFEPREVQSEDKAKMDARRWPRWAPMPVLSRGPVRPIWSTGSLASRWSCFSMATCRRWNEDQRASRVHEALAHVGYSISPAAWQSSRVMASIFRAASAPAAAGAAAAAGVAGAAAPAPAPAGLGLVFAAAPTLDASSAACDVTVPAAAAWSGSSCKVSQ